MLKRNKTISVICSITAGIICVIGVLMLLTVFGVIRLERSEITITTGDFEAKYYGKPITNHTWHISEGRLRSGHTIDVKFTGEQISVGESDNTVEVVIYDELGTDVTSDYKITYDLGLLKVNPRILVLSSASASKIYDGLPLVAKNYTLSDEQDGLVTGHKLNVVISGEQIEAGVSSNTVSHISVVDSKGADVTGNYQLVVKEGFLQVLSDGTIYPGGSSGSSGAGGIIEVSGSGALGGGGGGAQMESVILFVVYADETGNIYLRSESFGDYNGKGWTKPEPYPNLINDEYSAMYLTYNALANASSATHELKIKSLLGLYAVPYYLSNTHNIHEIQTSDVKSEGDVSDIYTVAYVRDTGKKESVSKEYFKFEIEYRSYVYNNYLGIDSETLDYMNSVIAEQGIKYNAKDVFSTIDQVAEYIQNCAKYNLDYDLALDEEENIVVAFMSEYKEGLCRHYASAATLMFRALGIPARYTTGALAEAERDTWVDVPASNAHAWVEVYIDGMGWVMVEVTGGSIGGGAGSGSGGGAGGGAGGSGNTPSSNKEYSVKPTQVAKKYDGTQLNAENTVTGLDDLLNIGYSYKAVVKGSRTEIGVSVSRITSLTVYDASGNDVTDTLNITLKAGRVHVYERELAFTSESVKKVYDGKAPNPGELTEGTLIEGHKYEVISLATANVGKSTNDFKVKITDRDGNDVTDHYFINMHRGSVNISHAEITLKAGDAEKKYDGTELVCNELKLVEGNLINGHKINFFVVEGSQTSVGRSENSIKYVSICDQSGKDVTKNYIIKCENGRLKVTYS